MTGISPWSVLLIILILIPSCYFIYAYIYRRKVSNSYSDADRYSRLKFLGYIIILLILGFAGGYLSTLLSSQFLYSFTMIVVTVAIIFITIKRLHDFNMNGWWSVLTLLPLTGLVIVIICLFTPPSIKEE